METCPLCNKPVEKDLEGKDPEVSYMDGWHHTACLDRYFGCDTHFGHEFPEVPKGERTRCTVCGVKATRE